MICVPMDIITEFPVRKSRQQKQCFRDAVIDYLKTIGYAPEVEAGQFGSRNIVFGNPDTADFIITAHYDTCVGLPFPNFITPSNALIFYLSKLLLWVSIILLGGIIGAAGGILLGPDKIPLFCTVALVGIFAFMIFGPANQSNVNDNTSGVITLLEIANTLPETQRKNVCFVLFDLEEAGLIGSASYRKTHRKATEKQLVFNLDCVGDGDHILMIPTPKLKKDRKKLTSLYKACGYFGKKSILIQEKGFSVYPSDQRSFPYGIGICALNEGKCGLYLSKIHTSRDTCLDMTNVNILRAALTSYICCNAVN